MGVPCQEDIVQLVARHPNGITDGQLAAALPDVPIETRAGLLNELSQRGLIQLLQRGTDIVYKSVSAGDSQVLATLEPEERIIYQYIKAADNRGIWVKDLKVKSNLHQNVLTKVLKTLESRRVIKSVKSIKNATKKVYMLFDIEPSADVTGGPWFSDNELDSAFIDGLAKACYRFIAARSSPRDPEALIPAGYQGYPTIESVHAFIAESGLANIDLSASDIAAVIEVLVLDDRVEKIPLGGRVVADADAEAEYCYRAVRHEASPELPMLAASPCATCPLLEQCADFGPVTPAKCEYLAKWLHY